MSVAVANVFVEFESKLSGLFATLDSLQARLDKLTKTDFEVGISVEDKTIRNIERIADAIESVANKFDRAEAVILSFVDSLDGTMGNLSTQVGTATKTIITDMDKVEMSVGHALETISERLTKIFNPRVIASGLTLSYVFKLLWDSGFNLSAVWKTFTGGGGSGGHMVAIFEALRNIIKTRDWALFGSVFDHLGTVVGNLVPRLFTLGGVVGMVLYSSRRLLDVFTGFLSRNPTSALMQFTQILKVTSSGMFRLEERMALLLERTRLFVGVTILLGTSFNNLVIGTTGFAAMLGPVVALVDIGVTLFRMAAVKVSNFILKFRAGLGDGRAQVQLLFMGLRQLYPIFTVLAEYAVPIANAIKGMAKGGLKNALAAIILTFDKLNKSLDRINKTLRELIRQLGSGVPMALKKIDNETRKSGGKSGGGVLDAVLPKKSASDADVMRRVSDFYATLTGAMKSAGVRNAPVFRSISTAWFSGALLFKRGAIAEALKSAFSHFTQQSASGGGGVGGAVMATPLAKSVAAYLPAAFKSAVAAKSTVITTAMSAALKTVMASVGTFAMKSLAYSLTGAAALGLLRVAAVPLAKLIGGSLKKGLTLAFKESLDLPPGLTVRFIRGAARLATQVGVTLSVLMPKRVKAALSGLVKGVGSVAQVGTATARVLVAAIAAGFGRTGFAAKQMQKAGETFNKSGLGPLVRNMFKGFAVLGPAAILDGLTVGGRLLAGMGKTALRLGALFKDKFKQAFTTGIPQGKLFAGLGDALTGARDKLKSIERLRKRAQATGQPPEEIKRLTDAADKLEKELKRKKSFKEILGKLITKESADGVKTNLSLIKRIFGAQGNDQRKGLFEPLRRGFISETENRKERQQKMNQAAATAATSLKGLGTDLTEARRILNDLKEGLIKSNTMSGFAAQAVQALDNLTEKSKDLGDLEKQAAASLSKSIKSIEDLQRIEAQVGGANTKKRAKAFSEMNASADELAKEQYDLVTKTEAASKYLENLAKAVEKYAEAVPEATAIAEVLHTRSKEMATSQDDVIAQLASYEHMLRDMVAHGQKTGSKTKPLTSMAGTLGIDVQGVVARAKAMIDSLHGVAADGKTVGSLFQHIIDGLKNSPAIGAAMNNIGSEQIELNEKFKALKLQLSKLLVKYKTAGTQGIFDAKTAHELEAALEPLQQGIIGFSKALRGDKDAAEEALKGLLRFEEDMVQASARQSATTDDKSASERNVGEGNKQLADALIEYSAVLDRMKKNTEGLENASKTAADALALAGKQFAASRRTMHLQDAAVSKVVAASSAYSGALVKAATQVLNTGQAGSAAVSTARTARALVSFIKSAGVAGLGSMSGDQAGHNTKNDTVLSNVAALVKTGFSPVGGGAQNARNNEDLKDFAQILSQVIAEGGTVTDIIKEMFSAINEAESPANMLNRLIGASKAVEEAFATGLAGPKALAETFKQDYMAGVKLITVLRALSGFAHGQGGKGRGFGLDTIIGRPEVLRDSLKKLGATGKVAGDTVKEIRDMSARMLAQGLGSNDAAELIVDKIIDSVQSLLKAKGLAEIPLSALLGRGTRQKTAEALSGKQSPLAKMLRGAMTPETMKEVEDLMQRLVASFKKMAPEIAANMTDGEDLITKATRLMFSGMEYDAMHGSPPRGFVGDIERSFGLAGTTIAQQLMHGLPDLIAGVKEFFEGGFGSATETAGALLKAPVDLAVAITQTGIAAITGTIQGFVKMASSILGVFPIVGTIVGAVLNGAAHLFGAITELLSRALGFIGDTIKAMIDGVTGAINFLTGSIQETADKIFQLGQEAKRANAEVSSFDLARRVFQQFGVDVTEVSQSVSIMRQSLSQARREGAGPLVASLELIGYSLDDIDKIDPTDMFLRIAEALKDLDPATEEYHNLLELVGGSLSNIRTALEDVGALRNAITNLSGAPLITNKDVDAAFSLNAALKTTDQFFEDIKKVSFSGLATGLKPLIDLFNNKAPKFMSRFLLMVKSVSTLGGGIVQKITSYVEKRYGSSGFSGLRRDAEALGQFMLARVKVYGSQATMWLMDKIADLVEYATAVVGPFLMEVSKKVGPFLVTITSALAAQVTLVGGFLAKKFDTMMSNLFASKSQEAVNNAVNDAAFELMKRDLNKVVSDLAESMGLLSFDTTGIRKKLSEIKLANKEAFSFDTLRKEAPEVAKLFDDIANDVEVFGDAFVKSMTEAGASAKDQEAAVRSAAARVKEMRGASQIDITVFSELSKRIADTSDQMTQLSEAFTVGTRAAMDNRRALSSQLDGVVTFRNKINSLVKSVEEQMSTILSSRGIPAEAVKALVEDIKKSTLGAFGPDLSELIRDTITEAVSPDAIAKRSGELEERIRQFVSKAASKYNVPATYLAANVNLQALFSGMLLEVRGVKREMDSLADVTAKVQELSQGWSVTLLDVGTAAKTIGLQYEIFENRINNVFDVLDRLAKERGQSVEKAREYAIQKAIVDELARQLGLQEATREAVLKQAAALVEVQKKAAAASAELNRFQAIKGVVDNATGALGNLAAAFADIEANAEGTSLAVEKAVLELQAMLQNDTSGKLLNTFQKWFKVTGSIEESVAGIAKQLREAAEAARRVQELQAAFDAFSKFDDVFRDKASPFEALKDQMGDARKEAFTLGMQMKIAAEESKAFLDVWAKRSPAQLVELAKNLEEAGHMQFTVELNEQNAVAIANEIGENMRAAIQEKLHNIKIRPLVDTIKSDLAGPVVSGFTEVLHGLADGTIAEAARTAREQARQAKIHFSSALFTVAQIGKGIFTKALDAFMTRLTDRMQDSLTKGLVSAIESSQVFGAIGKMSDATRNMIGMAASGLIAATGLILSKLQATANTVSADIASAVESTEAVRGVISGSTNVALKDVGEQLKAANRGIESRLDRILLAIIDYTGTSALAAPASPLADIVLTTR